MPSVQRSMAVEYYAMCRHGTLRSLGYWIRNPQQVSAFDSRFRPAPSPEAWNCAAPALPKAGAACLLARYPPIDALRWSFATEQNSLTRVGMHEPLTGGTNRMENRHEREGRNQRRRRLHQGRNERTRQIAGEPAQGAGRSIFAMKVGSKTARRRKQRSPERAIPRSSGEAENPPSTGGFST